MIRAIIIDDEPLAIQLLQSKLEGMKEYSIVGTYVSGVDLQEKVDVVDFDVAFIDINMKGINGIDLAEFLLSKKEKLQVVFVTAYEEYAVRAFELHAVDYLLKPVSNQRLEKTTKRLLETVTLFHSEDEVRESGTVSIGCFLELMVYHNQDLVSWKTSKVKELFAFLLTHHKQYIDRDLIIEALWPNDDYKKSKIHLHTCIYHLRKLLRTLGFDQAILFSDKCYLLSLQNVQIDVDEWLELMKNFEQNLDTFTDEQFMRMITLYKGKYLERNDYSWARDEAFTYHYKMVSFLKTMKVKYSQKGQYEKSLKCLSLLFKDDPYSEKLLKEMLDQLIHIGQKSEAHSLYIEFVERIQQDLGMEPSYELTNFYYHLVNE
ncbi:response regulator [Bacillus sp. JCM 19034]|uniref:response regulator n=1 Tax=Bacillus sp. JCM 19034 TaxID=1481928 RepID=UPI0018D08589|nr:response regulator [Bacillus sp. JCM 19034]